MDYNNSAYNTSNLSNLRVLNQNWSNVHPNFVPHFFHVFEGKSFGLKCGKIAVNNISSSYGTAEGDRFSIAIPYANQTLIWTIYFNIRNPELGPDFDFSDKSFLFDPNLNDFERNVPSLAHWNYEDRDSLLKVITELVLYYKKYQIDHLHKHASRLALEYELMLTKTEICDQDVEIILLPTVIDPTEIHFLIRIAVDFARLPKRNSLHNCDIVILQFTYRGCNWNRVTPQLLLSSNVEEIFGDSSNFHLPPFTSDNQLMDYVLDIKKLITNKIDSIVTNFGKRSEFINIALCLQGTSVVEYDNIEFSYISFLLNYKDFYFFVHFNLSLHFPIQPPKITLQSCYHLGSKDELYKNTLNNHSFPYSSRWEPEQIITKIFMYIIEKEINTFKANSIKNKRN